jgi:oligo-1,6-glucosidase
MTLLSSENIPQKMLTTHFSMKGTPYYYGDEIGMTNAKFDNVEDYRDIETLAEYERLQNTGGDLKQFIEDQKTVAREITGERLFNGTTLKTVFYC